MIELEHNLWDNTDPFQFAMRCITTNGYVNVKGQCVMGRGCAKEASERYPGFAVRVGDMIKAHGNQMFFFEDLGILTFPVKHVWDQPADIELIRLSANSLYQFAIRAPATPILLPRPGCGNGQLQWEQVKPYLEFLPDNVRVITFPRES